MEDPSEGSSPDLRDVPRRIRTLDHKFRRACDQIMLLNNRIDDMQSRYNSAMKLNRRSFRYSLRLKLATLEGIRNMFFEYASRCADNLEELQVVLLGDTDDTDSVDMNIAEGLHDELAASDNDDIETSDVSLGPFVYDAHEDSGSGPSLSEDNELGDAAALVGLAHAHAQVNVATSESPGSSGGLADIYLTSGSLSSDTESSGSSPLGGATADSGQFEDVVRTAELDCEEEGDVDDTEMHTPSLQDSGISDV